MKTLEQYLKESYTKSTLHEDQHFVVEGLVVNTRTRTVKLTDEHQNGVNFSLANNPVYDKINGIDVISIFKRTYLEGEFSNIDGNPFIYALKNKYNWKFDISQQDINKYIKRFIEICNKLNRKFDTIVIVPSKSNVNEQFMKSIAKYVSASNCIDDYFSKLSKQEILNRDLIDTVAIENDYPKTSDYIYSDIIKAMKQMPGNDFEAKNDKIKPYLKYIKYIIGEKSTNYIDVFQDKDVLILDDVFSTGSTISQCVNEINETFDCKSLTVITLLSKS